MTVVNASGNFSSPAYLGSRDDVISVAATDSNDDYWSAQRDRARGSTWRRTACTSLPRACVRPLSGDSIAVRQPGYRRAFDGTSFAAPQVAGAVALLQAQAPRARPRSAHAAGRAAAPGRDRRRRARAEPHDRRRGAAAEPAARAHRSARLPPRCAGWRARWVRPLVLRYNNGRSLIVYATSNQRLVAYDGVTADTAWIATLPGVPVGNVAGGAAGRGPWACVSSWAAPTGRCSAFATTARVLPGLAAHGARPHGPDDGGVALGDLDGDGVLEVVSMGSNGRLWAWHADGTVASGIPVRDRRASGASAPAFADVDGQPGVEILVLDGFSVLHAIDSHGRRALAWAAPPDAHGARGNPAGARGRAARHPGRRPDGRDGARLAGAPRWQSPLAVNVARPCPRSRRRRRRRGRAGGVRRSAHDARARRFRRRVAVGSRAGRSSTGVDRAGPARHRAAARGPRPCTGFYSLGRLRGVRRQRPGGARVSQARSRARGSRPRWPTCAATARRRWSRAARRTRTSCVLDAGPGTWDARFASWPTARGNGARTGNAHLRRRAPRSSTAPRPPPCATWPAWRALDRGAAAARGPPPATTASPGRAARVELRRAACADHRRDRSRPRTLVRHASAGRGRRARQRARHRACRGLHVVVRAARVRRARATRARSPTCVDASRPRPCRPGRSPTCA